MKDKRSKFKRPSKRREPRGLAILYEDRDILVVNKAGGILSVSTSKEKDHTAHALLTNYVKKGNQRSKQRVFIVHRLDRDTSGVLVFAKSHQAKTSLQEQWSEFSKTYIAIVHGILKEKEGVLTSHLTENKAFRVYAVTEPSKGRLARTGYKVIRESAEHSMLEIELFTGRKHQIRVQLADIGHPVVGDKMYGNSGKTIRKLGLHAASLTIRHPHTRELITFEAGLPAYFKALMKSTGRVTE